MTKGERHHLKGKATYMEVVLNLCANKEIVHKIMQEEHDVPMAKHYRERTTRVAIGKILYWPKMKQDV
jgi:hypothetical protein